MGSRLFTGATLIAMPCIVPELLLVWQTSSPIWAGKANQILPSLAPKMPVESVCYPGSK